MEDTLSISAELRAEAAKQNLTYADLASRLGISRQAVSKKLRDDAASYTDKQLSAYARALCIPASELMRHAEENKMNPGTPLNTTRIVANDYETH